MTFENNAILLRTAVEAEVVFDVSNDLDITCDVIRAKVCLSPRNCSEMNAELDVEDSFMMINLTPHLNQLKRRYNSSLAYSTISVALFDFEYRQYTKNSSVLVLHRLSKEELADGIDLNVEGQGQVGRERRSVPEKEMANPNCDVYHWDVHFAQIGWDFVLEPAQFVPNYCAGNCPRTGNPTGYSMSNHALVKHYFSEKSLLNDLEPSLTRSCCVPRRMEPLSVFYRYNNGTTKIRLLSEMMVNECACY